MIGYENNTFSTKINKFGKNFKMPKIKGVKAIHHQIPEDPKVIRQRWKKKKTNIGAMAHNIRSLRNNITRDMKSDDEKVALTALAVSLMDKTAERVGNEESADNGHIGITGLQKKHISVDGNTVKLKYKGKSGVEHEKAITDADLAESVKKAINNSPTRYLCVPQTSSA